MFRFKEFDFMWKLNRVDCVKCPKIRQQEQQNECKEARNKKTHTTPY